MAGKPLTQAHHNILLVSIKNTFEKYGRDPDALYDSTRGGWIVDSNKIDKIEYLGGVVSKTIVSLYKVAGAFREGSTRYAFREQLEDTGSNRTEFVGREADAAIKDLYIGKTVGGKGNIMSPVYLGPAFGYKKFVDGAWIT